MDRRRFIQASLGAAAMGASWRLWAASGSQPLPRLVTVFLRGAYDSLSVLVPYDEPFYYASRPNIAIARPDPDDLQASIKLDNRWALHPALSESLLPFWNDKQLAFVPFAGTEFVSRSHFQAQDWIEYGQAAGGRMVSSSGFLNRLLQQLGIADSRSPGIGFTQTLPEILRGQVPIANSPVRMQKMPIDIDIEQQLRAMYAHHELAKPVQDGLGLRRDISAELKEEMMASSRGALPPSGFALEAARIGKFMRDHPQYVVGFADVGGWDTHVGQGGAYGLLANRVRGLGEGLKAMAHALGPEWQRTVVVVISEFGRTFRENGSRGTDHGHGTAMWVLGGGVSGGTLRGEQSGLAEADLHEHRDVRVLNEYRAVLAGLYGRLYDLDANALRFIFPGVTAQDLRLV